MYSEEDKDTYFLHKILTAIMFDNEYDYYKEIPWIYDLDVLEEFEMLVLSFSKYGCLNNDIKNNIYKILIDGRDIEDENYEERINKINKITSALNNQQEDNSIKFYVGQMCRRRDNKKELKKYTIYDIEREIDYLNSSIFNDFVVLLSHGDGVSDEEFLNGYLEEFVNNDMYYESLNIILKECPSVFSSETFRKRINTVLKINKKLHYKKNKTIKKIIKKYK